MEARVANFSEERMVAGGAGLRIRALGVRRHMGVRTKFLHYLAVSGGDAAAGNRRAWPFPYIADQLAAMVAHQAPGVHLPAGLLTRLGQRIQE